MWEQDGVSLFWEKSSQTYWQLFVLNYSLIIIFALLKKQNENRKSL